MDEFITATEATKLLGISQHTMAQMLQEGVLVWRPDPFNKRAKLVKRSDVETLLANAPRKPRPRRKSQEDAPKELTPAAA
jgi:hypothetical protein